MAITATITPLQTFGPFAMSTGAYGAVSQGDGSYLAAYSTTFGGFPSAATAHWLRSIDRGLTWSARGGGHGIFGQGQYFPANCRSNILLFPGRDPHTSETFIYRSTDGAATFATAYSAATASSPNGRDAEIVGIQSYDRTKAIAWGELDGDNNNPPYIYGLSADAGATWTPQVSFDIGDAFDRANAFGIAANGEWYLAYIKFGGTNRESYLAHSTNFGSTWSVQTRTRSTDGTSFLIAQAITSFDGPNIILAGLDQIISTGSVPMLWWSNDNGSSLNLVSGSDVANWPSGASSTASREVKRLTRDAAFWAFDMQNGASGCPYRISLDMGHTWPIEPTRSSGSWQTYTIPLGKTVVTREGRILSMALESPDYVQGNMTIYGTTLTC